MNIVTRPRMIRGAAARDVIDLLELVARWKENLPNDPDSIREAGAAAALALAHVEDAAAPMTGRSLDRSLPLDELNAPRRHFLKCRMQAERNAETLFGERWNTIRGHLWWIRKPRLLARYVSRDFKVSFDEIETRAPAQRFWDEVPEGVVFLGPWEAKWLRAPYKTE